MFSEPSVPPHSLSRVDIAISRDVGERVSNQYRIYHPTNAGFTTPPSPAPLVQGPNGATIPEFLATSQPTIPPAPVTFSPNRIPVRVDELASTQIIRRFISVSILYHYPEYSC